MEEYKEGIRNVLISGRKTLSSYLSEEKLPRDLFKEIFNIIFKNITLVYLLTYAKMSPPIYLIKQKFNRVECTKCNTSWTSEEYFNMYETHLRKRMLYNAMKTKTIQIDLTKETPPLNCGCVRGQCTICPNCNPLYYIPRTQIFYCKEHSCDLYYSKKYGVFSSLYKGTGKLKDMVMVKDNEEMLQKLSEASVLISVENTRATLDHEWWKKYGMPHNIIHVSKEDVICEEFECNEEPLRSPINFIPCQNRGDEFYYRNEPFIFLNEDSLNKDPVVKKQKTECLD